MPASRSGFVVQAHAVNNTFHAFTLLQIIIGEHAEALGVKRDIAPRQPDMERDTADFQWLQIGAYADGELVQPMLGCWLRWRPMRAPSATGRDSTASSTTRSSRR
ncbi:hypothetical protein G6F65_023056 [Rhizopus arrhizus]|nr:hypothetical protein G6F65_023056 [Rhizopus arrhizus]